MANLNLGQTSSSSANMMVNYMLSEGVGSVGEAVRGNTWEVTINDFDDIVLFASTVALPTLTVAQIEVAHFNEKLKIAGLVDTPNITIEVMDTINPDIASQLYDWYSSIYDPQTGAIGFASEYKKQGAIIQYDTKGNKIRHYILQGMWPTTCTMGSLDYTSADPIKLSIDFSVDKAILVTKSMTSGASYGTSKKDSSNYNTGFRNTSA